MKMRKIIKKRRTADEECINVQKEEKRHVKKRYRDEKQKKSRRRAMLI